MKMFRSLFDASFRGLVLCAGGLALVLAGTPASVRADELPQLISKIPPATPEQDDEWRKVILGTWKYHRAVTGGAYDGRTTYTKDGKFDSRVVYTSKEVRSVIILRGNWRIEYGLLVCRVRRSSSPSIPEGAQTSDRILQLDGEVLRYLNESSVKMEERRQSTW